MSNHMSKQNCYVQDTNQVQFITFCFKKEVPIYSGPQGWGLGSWHQDQSTCCQPGVGCCRGRPYRSTKWHQLAHYTPADWDCHAIYLCMEKANEFRYKRQLYMWLVNCYTSHSTPHKITIKHSPTVSYKLVFYSTSNWFGIFSRYYSVKVTTTTSSWLLTVILNHLE